MTTRARLCVAVAVTFAVALLSACAPTPAEAPSGSPAGSEAATHVAVPVDLKSYDWSDLALPASSCDSAATGDIELLNGTGTVTVDSMTVYDVSVDLPPAIGEAGGQTVAVMTYSCLLRGANGVGAFPIAVFRAGEDGVELLGILRNHDLGSSATPSSLVDVTVTFVDGEIIFAGKFLTANDARCCATGVGWSSVKLSDGRLIPSGVIATGPVPTTLPTDLIVYEPPARIEHESDLQQLADAPSGFADAVWRQKLASDVAGCGAVYTVHRVTGRGFAIGGSECSGGGAGGADTLWSRDADGTWTIFARPQNTVSCATLAAVGFPADVYGYGVCLDSQFNAVPYSG